MNKKKKALYLIMRVTFASSCICEGSRKNSFFKKDKVKRISGYEL